jgi:hypothetical protein
LGRVDTTPPLAASDAPGLAIRTAVEAFLPMPFSMSKRSARRGRLTRLSLAPQVPAALSESRTLRLGQTLAAGRGRAAHAEPGRLRLATPVCGRARVLGAGTGRGFPAANVRNGSIRTLAGNCSCVHRRILPPNPCRYFDAGATRTSSTTQEHLP